MKKFFLVVVIIFIISMFSSCQLLDSVFHSGDSDEFSDDIAENMQGFWFLTGTNGEISEDTKQTGIAIDVDGTTIDTYVGFEIDQQNKHLNISENDTFIYLIGGSEGEANVDFQKKDGYTLMTLRSSSENLIFEKTDFETFNLYKGMTEAEPVLERGGKTVYLSDSLSDEELIFYITDTFWFELYFMCSDGSTAEMLENTFILYSNGTGVDEFTDSTEFITWEIEDGYLYIYYDDDSVFYSPVDYAYDAATGYIYLYLYDQNEGYEGCAWIYYNYIE